MVSLGLSLFKPFLSLLHLFAISHAADSTHPARSTASQASFKCSKHLERFAKRSQRVHTCSLNNFAVSYGVVTRRFAEQRVEGAKSLREKPIREEKSNPQNAQTNKKKPRGQTCCHMAEVCAPFMSFQHLSSPFHSSHAFLPEQTTLALVASNSFVMHMTASKPQLKHTRDLLDTLRTLRTLWSFRGVMPSIIGIRLSDCQYKHMQSYTNVTETLANIGQQIVQHSVVESGWIVEVPFHSSGQLLKAKRRRKERKEMRKFIRSFRWNVSKTFQTMQSIQSSLPSICSIGNVQQQYSRCRCLMTHAYDQIWMYDNICILRPRTSRHFRCALMPPSIILHQHHAFNLVVQARDDFGTCLRYIIRPKAFTHRTGSVFLVPANSPPIVHWILYRMGMMVASAWYPSISSVFR